MIIIILKILLCFALPLNSLLCIGALMEATETNVDGNSKTKANAKDYAVLYFFLAAFALCGLIAIHLN